MNKITFKNASIEKECLEIINELGLNIEKGYLEIDNKMVRKFINKLKKNCPNLTIINEENYKIIEIGINDMLPDTNVNKNLFSKEQIDELKKIFVTKEDLKNELKEFGKNFVTKEDLKNELKEFSKNFVTKEDLKNELKEFSKNFVTKDDLKNELKEFGKNFVTKDDLKNELKELRKNFVTKEDLKNELKEFGKALIQEFIKINESSKG